MMTRMLKNQRGDLNVGFLIQFFCFICALLTVISLFQVFTTHSNVSFVARRVARAVEVTGAYDSNITAYFSELVDTVGLQGARLDIDASYIPGGKRIQLRDRFTVTVSYDGEWLLFQPLGYRVALPLYYRGRISGMSEVFHK